jgi:hypothetical protein
MGTASLAPTGAPLSGLSGLYGDPQDTVDLMDEGVLEAKANALNPEHGSYGSQAYGYSGTVPTASPFVGSSYDAGMSGIDYTEVFYDSEGHADDQTPTSHSAAYPRGIIQPSWESPDGEYSRAGDQLRTVHGADLGGPEFYVNTAIADNLAGTDWSVDRYDSTDDVALASSPGQLKTTSSMSANGRGAGGADVSQGYGVANSLPEFAHGHSIRYVQHDKMPQDYTNTHGEQDVPFMGRHPVQQANWSGPDSPYYEMGDTDRAQIPWEGRIGDPHTYVQPPEPTISPAPLSSEDVWAYAY